MKHPAPNWAEEPYRWFFPLGILAGIFGVSLWPLWFAGVLPQYPGPAHARIMTEGFFVAFIFGFLGTAGPRMIEVRALSSPVWWSVAGLWLLGQIASVAGLHNLAEAGFVAALLVFGLAFVAKFPGRRDLPPAGFLLVALSLTLAIPAAISQMPWVQQNLASAPSLVWIFGRAFLTEGMVLLPMLGAAPFFFGRFGGLPPRHDSPESFGATPAWSRQASIVLATAVVLLACLLAKSMGHVRAGAGLQAIIIALYIGTQVPFRYPRRSGVLAHIAQGALLALILAPLAEAVWPGQRMAWRHLLMIPGFQFAAVAVGTWVAYAHAGYRERCRQRWIGLALIALLWLAATGSRLGAEWNPGIRDAHLIYAALIWMGASLAWLAILLPKLREEG